jgi:hypothetical protein
MTHRVQARKHGHYSQEFSIPASTPHNMHRGQLLRLLLARLPNRSASTAISRTATKSVSFYGNFSYCYQSDQLLQLFFAQIQERSWAENRMVNVGLRLCFYWFQGKFSARPLLDTRAVSFYGHSSHCYQSGQLLRRFPVLLPKQPALHSAAFDF